MTSREINAIRALRGPKYTLTEMAARIREDRTHLTRVLNYDLPDGRKTARIRRKVEKDLGIPAEELWDDMAVAASSAVT